VILTVFSRRSDSSRAFNELAGVFTETVPYYDDLYGPRAPGRSTQ
jgi:hypothetical protein